MIRVCFVCLGNICRSPTAEAVLRKLVADAGLSHAIAVASAGTAGYHEGDPSDDRSRAHGKRRGYALDGRARQFRAADFARFDYVLAMDNANLANLRELAPDADAHAKLSLLRAFDDASPVGSDVPDPYYGGAAGFEEVITLCERACVGLLRRLRERHGV